MKTCPTGGAGHVAGASLLRRPLGRSHAPVAADDPCAGDRAAVPWAADGLVAGDLDDAAALAVVM